MKGITSERSSLMGRAVLSFTLIVRVQFKQLCRDGILTLNKISFWALTNPTFLPSNFKPKSL